ncbi:MAG: hypothetical protein KY397_03690 [Gemmatimonadetes bacterium]|nr:hypothetical protein [Gemmatimonadota bacterium]
MRSLTTLVLALIAFGAASAARAQSTATVSADVTIPTVLSVSIDKASVSFSPVASDYDTGWVDAEAADNDAVLTHKGNVAHSVYISTTSEYFDASNPANDNLKPSSHLQWRKDNAGSFTGITFTNDPAVDADAVVANATKGTGTAEVDYRLQLDLTTDAPDTYTLDFVYTIAAD